MTRKSGVLAAILAAFFLLSSPVPSRALDRDDERCHRQVEKAERNLDKAIRRHGEHSPQAERRRRQLEEARERCHRDRDHDHH